jgi:hypothetical protein
LNVRRGKRILLPYWKTGHRTSEKKMVTTVPLVSEQVMTQSLRQKKETKTIGLMDERNSNSLLKVEFHVTSETSLLYRVNICF